MDDAALVAHRQAPRHVGHHAKCDGLIELAAFVKNVGEALPGNELQREVVLPFILVDLEKVRHIGIVDLGEEPGFLVKAAEGVGVFRPVGAKDLDGDDGAVGGVFGAVDLAHAALAELVEQAKTAQVRATEALVGWEYLEGDVAVDVECVGGGQVAGCFDGLTYAAEAVADGRHRGAVGRVGGEHRPQLLAEREGDDFRQTLEASESAFDVIRRPWRGAEP